MNLFLVHASMSGASLSLYVRADDEGEALRHFISYYFEPDWTDPTQVADAYANLDGDPGPQFDLLRETLGEPSGAISWDDLHRST
jgi:hypothetical protein